jgi:fibronectin type 3 domain-containing protein
MNPDTVPSSGRQRIMGGHDAYELVLESGRIQSQFFAGGSQDVQSTSQISPGQWYHIAAAYDFANTNTLEIFINGVREASNSFADDDPGGPFTLSFGTRTGRTEYYQGTLDNVRLYGRVLSEAEVAQVMLDEQDVSDSTPPTTPTNVTALAESESQIGLSWTAASDPQSGVSFYTVYRNGANVGTTSQTQVTDSGLTEGTTYSYRVSATNGAGLEGPLSAPVNGTTLAELAP